MSKGLCGTSTGVTGENEPVITNEPEGIALKANPAQPLGRQAAVVGEILKNKQANKSPKAVMCRFSSLSCQVRVNLLDLSPGRPECFVIQ